MSITRNNVYSVLISIILFGFTTVDCLNTTILQNMTVNLTNMHMIFECQNKGHYYKTIMDNELQKTELTTLWRTLYEIQRILTGFYCKRAA
uniref:Hypotheticial protein n=1 Tax=Schistosoma japonicum TaxID=6182 RepID=C1LGJ3_SCHJA|nr:hypotheticial protein [Schistosoma japonicum]